VQIELPLEKIDAPVLITFPAKPTREEMIALCQANPDVNFELRADGTIVITLPEAPETSHRNAEIGIELAKWAERDGRGQTLDAGALITLPNGAMRSPDVAWISNARLQAMPAPDGKVFGRVIPDFVIELKSPSHRLKDLHTRMFEWMDHGVTLGWLIDPYRREIFVYRSAQINTRAMPQTLIAPAQVDGEGPVAGFVLDLNPVWAKR
jgi:Uma2 family endonuclease